LGVLDEGTLRPPALTQSTREKWTRLLVRPWCSYSTVHKKTTKKSEGLGKYGKTSQIKWEMLSYSTKPYKGVVSMYKISDYLKIEEAAEVLGITSNTLRKWEKEKKIKVYRNPINKYRMYLKEDLEALLKDIENSYVSRNLREI
jgi:excisionase family DNA binding protein